MYFVCIDFINININVGCFEPPQISSIKVNLPFFLQRKLQHTLGEKPKVVTTSRQLIKVT